MNVFVHEIGDALLLISVTGPPVTASLWSETLSETTPSPCLGSLEVRRSEEILTCKREREVARLHPAVSLTVPDGVLLAILRGTKNSDAVLFSDLK